MKTRALFVPLALAVAISGCAVSQRLEEIGRPPALSPIALPDPALIAKPGPRPVAHGVPDGQANQLWRAGARSFFRDPRAAKIGDILTVNIAIGDEATIANTTSRRRAGSESADLTKFFGLETLLPDALDPTNLADFGSEGSSSGTGTVNRSEEINLTIAAVVTDVLPNGNLVIQGHQEVRVNFEMRELTISGVVRPEDISNANTINHTQIAEARISYGGRGHISDVQQPRLGQQLFDIIAPF